MRLLRRAWRDRRGVAAVEFALVLPILAGIVVFLPDASDAAIGALNMDAGVRAGVQYAMNGGTDLNLAKTIATQNWAYMPNGATLDVTQSCICGGGGGVCGQPCGDGSNPQVFVTVAGAATVGGTVISIPLQKTQTVRIK